MENKLSWDIQSVTVKPRVTTIAAHLFNWSFLVEKNSVLFIAFESSNENGRKDNTSTFWYLLILLILPSLKQNTAPANKWLELRLFLFGAKGLFSGAFAVSFRKGMYHVPGESSQLLLVFEWEKQLPWLVVSTPLKNISQNGNLPQGSGWK